MCEYFIRFKKISQSVLYDIDKETARGDKYEKNLRLVGSFISDRDDYDGFPTCECNR